MSNTNILQNQGHEGINSQAGSTTLTIKFVGAAVIIGMVSLGISLPAMLWRNDQRELAVITMVVGGITNVISLGIGVLIPSPLQSSRTRASDKALGDEEGATGKPEDPVHVTPTNSFNPAPDPELPDATQEELDFGVTEPFPRGIADTVDDDYLADEEGEPKADV